MIYHDTAAGGDADELDVTEICRIHGQAFLRLRECVDGERLSAMIEGWP
jgi:hypothetical protein